MRMHARSYLSSTGMARLRAENHLSKTIFDVRAYMQNILIVGACLAILLTLAPFYPPGDTESGQKWLLFAVAVS